MSGMKLSAAAIQGGPPSPGTTEVAEVSAKADSFPNHAVAAY